VKTAPEACASHLAVAPVAACCAGGSACQQTRRQHRLTD